MAALELHAYAFAATFRLADVAAAFEGAVATPDADKDRLIARFPSENDGLPRMAFIYDFGAVVFVGLNATDRARHVAALTARLTTEPHAPLTEHFLVEQLPVAQPEVRFDRVLVPEASVAVLDIVALLLAQSAVMDYYREDVDEIGQRSDRITRGLHTTGRIPESIRGLTRFIGSCMATRNDILASLALFDKPDATWDDPVLDRVYIGLREELEIDDRFRVLESKLRSIQDNLVLFVEVSQSRSAWRLEFVVVVLILVEIGLTLWTLWRGP